MPESRSETRRSLWWVDLVVFTALCIFSACISLKYTHGDLWLDEADYAIAGLHGFADNRWDKSDKPDQPDMLIRLRHYHAPATAYALEAAHRYGSDEETLRLPFVAAGALSVGMVYLCGLALFGSRREVAAGCAALTAITPANIRMASHAVPWAFIILELLALLLFTLLFARTRHGSWLIWLGVSLGLLFVTSETFFVAAAAIAVALPVVLLPEIATCLSRAPETAGAPESATPERRIERGGLLRGAIGGAAGFLVVAIILWPAGLRGDCVMMLRHYLEMRHTDAFPVNIGSTIYKSAPKWAYLFWYWNYYRPFFLCYAAGLVAAAGWALVKIRSLRQPPGMRARMDRSEPRNAVYPLVLLIYSAVYLASAHKAHIIGPEYLAHCLPFLSLCAGYVVYAASLCSRPAGVAAIAAAAIVFGRWIPSRALPGMDERTQITRWREAVGRIAPRWQEPDRLLLGPQSSNVAYWYLHEVAHIPIHDWQIGQFSLAGPGPNFLHNLAIGKYRWVVISSQFEDRVINAADPRSMAILHGWELVLMSNEHNLGPPRLTVFRCPEPP